MNVGDKVTNLEPTIMDPKVYSYFKNYLQSKCFTI